MALPVKGKKSRLTRHDLLKYFARERLQLNEGILSDLMSRFSKAMPAWRELLDNSFLSVEAKQKYAALLAEREKRMQLGLQP